jgi:hypothetical protein
VDIFNQPFNIGSRRAACLQLTWPDQTLWPFFKQIYKSCHSERSCRAGGNVVVESAFTTAILSGAAASALR